jgi:cysteine desulfurase
MNSEPAIYFDHNSTTPIHPEVAKVIADSYAVGYLNPASQHQFGQLARRSLEAARSSMVNLLGGQSKGMDADQLIITSGGTESNNLALIGLTLAKFEESKRLAPDSNPGDYCVLISAMEHPSVIGAAEQLARLGFSVRRIGVNQHGIVDLQQLGLLIDGQTLLVSIMLANNETGVIQPVREAAEICWRQGVWIHTDAVQAVGKIPVHFTNLGVDAISFTPHKFHGPRGIGGLLLKHGTGIQPILFGGFQQMARRPGTEDVALTLGMERALRLFVEEPEHYRRVAEFRDRLQSELAAQIPAAVVVGAAVERLPTTLNIAFPGVNRQAFLMAADLAGVAVSTGSACASGSSETSPVLLAMNLPESIAESAIRISLGATTTAVEIEIGARRISSIIKHLCQC